MNPRLRLYNSCTITQHFHSCVISGFGHGVNEICALLGFYAAPIGSFLLFRDNSWWWWNSDSGVGEHSSHLGHFVLLTVNLPPSSGPTAQDKAAMFRQNVCNPSPVDRAYLTPVWEHHLSQNRKPCWAKLLRMMRLLCFCDDHCRIHKSPIVDIFFISCTMIY